MNSCALISSKSKGVIDYCIDILHRVAAIPLLVILSRNGKVISDYAKKPVESASSSHDEITRLYNNWMRKLLEINGIPVPEEEVRV